jgi:hypothetical protein
MREPPTKKTWEKPELIVLVRSRPEEAVLATCKRLAGGAAPGAANRCRVTCQAARSS